MKIDRDSVVVAAKEQVSRNTGRETVVAGLRKGRYYALSDVGARVWELVQQPIAARDLQQVITQEYEVPPERCEADLLRLLSDLADEQLICVSDD